MGGDEVNDIGLGTGLGLGLDHTVQRETGKLAGALGKAVIAMTAVLIRACVEPDKVTDLSDIRPPTDVMAITSLPQTQPVIRSPVPP